MIFKFRKRAQDNLTVNLIVLGKDGYIQKAIINEKELQAFKSGPNIPDGAIILVSNGGS